MPTPKYVTVTVTLAVRDAKKLRAECFRRFPETKDEGYALRTLAQFLVDDAERLQLDAAGLEVIESGSEDGGM